MTVFIAGWPLADSAAHVSVLLLDVSTAGREDQTDGHSEGRSEVQACSNPSMHSSSATEGDGTATQPPSAETSIPLPFCYVMCTSGSTGTPLGVCGTEQGADDTQAHLPQA